MYNKLIVDKYFGIYNRNGLEYILNSLNKKTFFAKLIDFNCVKKMNETYGYRSVNDTFNKAFSEIKETYIVGRAFSGDEIFIISDTKINDDLLKNIFNKYNLYYKSIDEIYNSEKDNIEDFLDKMIDILHG